MLSLSHELHETENLFLQNQVTRVKVLLLLHGGRHMKRHDNTLLATYINQIFAFFQKGVLGSYFQEKLHKYAQLKNRNPLHHKDSELSKVHFRSLNSTLQFSCFTAPD